MILRFVVIALIYLVIFRIIKIMYMDLKGVRVKKLKEFALEVKGAPKDANLGSLYLIHKVMTIGRNPDNDIVIKDPYVSGNHARFYVKNDKLFVEDLNSTNGTFVNGKRISKVEKLQEGDIIEIGRVSFKVLE